MNLSYRGFTLLELVVALGVFAVIGMISLQLLSQSIAVTEKVLTRSDQLLDIQRAIHVIQRDFEQHAGRSIRNEFGDRSASIELRSRTEIEFTRNGWSNPLNQIRSNLQRVSYVVNGEQLVRRFWYVLDQPNAPQHRDQIVLDEVREIWFNVIDEEGQEHVIWPNHSANSQEIHQRAIAIRVSMNIEAYGTFSWLINLPDVADYTPRIETLIQI